MERCECGYEPREGENLLWREPSKAGERWTYECMICGAEVPFGEPATFEDIRDGLGLEFRTYSIGEDGKATPE